MQVVGLQATNVYGLGLGNGLGAEINRDELRFFRMSIGFGSPKMCEPHHLTH